MEETIDIRARSRAEEAHTKMDGHEQLCAERYQNIHSRIGLVLKVLAWGGGVLTTIVLALIGFLAARAVEQSESNQELLRQRLQQLEQVVATEATPSTH